MDAAQKQKLLILNNAFMVAVLARQVVKEQTAEEGQRKTKSHRYRLEPCLQRDNSKDEKVQNLPKMLPTAAQRFDDFHMSSHTFGMLYEMLRKHLIPKSNIHEVMIPPEAQLAAVLAYFASGDLHYFVDMSDAMIDTMLENVCNAISLELCSEIPVWTANKIVYYANKFMEKCQLPNCAGAIDGKHVRLRVAPSDAGEAPSINDFSTTTLLAICDATYRFTYIDVGPYGKRNASRTVWQSRLGQALFSDQLEFPADQPINGKQTPYFLVGNESFPQCKRIFKAYTTNKTITHITPQERIFNYRLQRARLCIENAFGLLVSKWIVMQRVLSCNPHKANKIVYAICLLHNYLMRVSQANYIGSTDWTTNSDVKESLIRNALPAYDDGPQDDSMDFRHNLKEYVNSVEGALPWQSIVI